MLNSNCITRIFRIVKIASTALILWFTDTQAYECVICPTWSLTNQDLNVCSSMQLRWGCLVVKTNKYEAYGESPWMDGQSITVGSQIHMQIGLQSTYTACT